MDIEKMFKEILKSRKSQRSRELTCIRPTGSSSIGMDFASLHPSSSITMIFPHKQTIRKNKIKKLFT